MQFLLKLDKYHLVLFLTVLVSLTCNVIILGGSIEVHDSKLLVKLLAADDGCIGTGAIEEISETVLQDGQQYSKIKKEDGVYKVMLEEGDSLVELFRELQIDQRNSHLISSSVDKIYKLNKLRAGEEIQISFLNYNDQVADNLNKIEQIIIDTSGTKIQINYDVDKKQYNAKLLPLILQNKMAYVAGKVTNSFFQSAQNNGVSRAVAMDFIKIFSHQIDFQRDLDFGSKFKIVHELQVNEGGKKVKDGRILYASLQTKGKHIEIYMHELHDGTFEYFNKDGSSIKKVLLRTPVKSAIISSGFGLRTHPVLGYSRMHRGLDYAAPRGTPVIAAGDGIIEIMKYHGNYGRYVKIKHNKKYSTLYAHLDRFSKKFSTGSKIKQGDVIGYVGSTGMSTGPHLHYEVHVDGKQVNPAKVTIMSKMLNLEGSQLLAFKSRQNEINNLLDNDVAFVEPINLMKN